MDKRTVLVTGASSGIGEATALALQADGYRVYAAARRVERMAHLAEHGINVIALDVTDEASLVAAVASIEKDAGMVDVLINNAGYGSYGAFEDVPMSEARRQAEVNLFGLARLTQLVIPKMRTARRGTIVNISSIGGKFGEAYGSWYHATKFAVEGLSDSLALELAPFGIKVVCVEPGGIKTEWAGIAADRLAELSGTGAYSEAVQRKVAMMREYDKMSGISPPEAVARGIVKILRMRNPKFRYPIAGGAEPLLFLRRYTSDRLFYRILTRLIG